MQTRQRLPWFLDSLPSEDCAKGGAGAYTDALQRSAKESSGIKVLSAACLFPSLTMVLQNSVVFRPMHILHDCISCHAELDVCVRRAVCKFWLGVITVKPVLQGLGEGKVAVSSFRTSYVPLNKQSDFISGMQVLFSKVTCIVSDSSLSLAEAMHGS